MDLVTSGGGGETQREGDSQCPHSRMMAAITGHVLESFTHGRRLMNTPTSLIMEQCRACPCVRRACVSL